MRRALANVCLMAAIGLAVACTAAPETSTSSSRLAMPASATLPAAITSLTAINGTSSVVAGLADGRIAVWTTADEPVLLKPHATRILAVGSSTNGREGWSLAVDGSLARTRLEAEASPTSQQIDLGSAPTRAAAFSSDGTLLVTGGEFGDVRVFDTTSGALRQTLRGHRTEMQALAVRPGSTIVASASAEADLRLWDGATGRELTAVATDLSLFALGFSPRDGTLASGGVDRRVTLRDAATYASVGTFDLPAPALVASLAWSPDGQWLAIGDVDDATLAKGGLRVVDVRTREEVVSLDTGSEPPSALTFVGAGSVLVGAFGQDLRAWPLPAAR